MQPTSGSAQISALRDYAAKEGLTNVTVIEGAVNAMNLPPGCCDAILVRDAYHHLTQPQGIVRSLAAALKPGGRLAVIDFPPRPNTEVPAGVPANRLGHGVPPEVVQREVSAALTHVQTIASWGAGEPTRLALSPVVRENRRLAPRPRDNARWPTYGVALEYMAHGAYHPGTILAAVDGRTGRVSAAGGRTCRAHALKRFLLYVVSGFSRTSGISA